MQVVSSYRLHWNTILHTGSIDLRLQDGADVTLTAHDPGHLILWVDMLKHEQPVYYWKNSDGEGLVSDWEEVESSQDGMMKPATKGKGGGVMGEQT